MTRRRILILLASSMAVAVAGLAVITVAYGYAAYYGDWNEQPYYGNHWWYNGSQLDWYADDYWTTDRLQSMQNGHNSWPWKEYRIEQEAYKAENPTSYCDRLVISSYDAMDLPVTQFNQGNGCGSSSYLEELKIELDENSVTANTWLRHRVTYNKQGSGSGEVNYSFSNN